MSGARSILRNPWIWAFVIGIVSLTAIRPLLRRVPEPPPVIAQLPSFSLTDQRGQPFGSAELEGRVWVAGFFFTRCPTICPKLMQSMGRLVERYDRQGVDIRVVAISVDPEVDTPEVLADYAGRLGADPERWTLLTGPQETIDRLVLQGFKAPLGEAEPYGEGDAYDIVHSGRLVLVDGDGGIRGHYDSTGEGIEEVFHRSLHVLWKSE